MKVLERLLMEKKDSKSWSKLINYCILKQKGLRKEALKSLNLFLNDLEEYSFDKLKEFIGEFFGFIEESEQTDEVLIHTFKEFINKFLYKWIQRENNDPRPYRWIGVFTYIHSENCNRVELLKKAIEYGGEEEQLAIKRLLEIYLNELEYNVHELPYGYLGDPEDDFKTVEEINYLIHKVKNIEIKSRFKEGMEYYKGIIGEWVCYKSAKCKGDFYT